MIVSRLMLNVRNPRLLEEMSMDFDGSAIAETGIFFSDPGDESLQATEASLA